MMASEDRRELKVILFQDKTHTHARTKSEIIIKKAGKQKSLCAKTGSYTKKQKQNMKSWERKERKTIISLINLV